MRAALIAAALLVVAVSARSIKWTGYANNNQWTSAVNWYPAQVPGPNDDVSINEGSVQVTVGVAIQSLSMGNSFSSAANITIYKDFYVSNTFTVEGNGNLFVQAGTDTVTGTFNIAGNFYYLGGSLAGTWTTSKTGVAHMGNAGQKAFVGCNFISGGTLTLGGVIALNQSSTITINGGATASGAVEIQVQDGSASLFDASPSKFTYSGSLLSVQAPTNFGVVDFQGDVSLFSTVNFGQALTINSGITVHTLGNLAIVNMSNGVSGAGKLVGEGNWLTLGGVSLTGTLSVKGGNVSFGAAGNTIGTFNLAGGTAQMPNSVSATTLNINGGELAQGAGSVSAITANVETNGFDLNGKVAITGTANFAPSLISFGPAGGLHLGVNSTSNVAGTFTVNGQPGNGGITANGKMAITGSLSTTNVNIEGSGSMTVAQEISVQVATFTQNSIALASGAVFSGSNSWLTIGVVSAPSTVVATVGDYTFTCQKECDNISTPNKSKIPAFPVKLAGQ